MKLYEIDLAQEKMPFERRAEIQHFIDEQDIKNADINVNYEIDVKGSVRLHGKMKSLPYKFNVVMGEFNASQTELIDCKNFPKVVGGKLELGDYVESLEGISRSLKSHFYADNPPVFESLEGIADYFDEIDGDFVLDFDRVKRGGLGLLNIRGLQRIRPYVGTNFPTSFKIIQKHIENKTDIFECQNELIEAGFEEFATL